MLLHESEALCRAFARACPGVPLIVLSNAGGEIPAIQAFEAGASDFVRLPVGPGELAARIARFAKLQPAARAPVAFPRLRQGKIVVQMDPCFDL